MRKVMSILLKIGGAAIVITGVVCLVKWAVTELADNKKNENDKETDASNINDGFEKMPEKNDAPDVDINVARSDAAEEITLRHQEASKVMQEMLAEIDGSTKDENKDVDTEGRLNFDDIDASLDKLFDEE